jgi:glutamine amidotransferase
MKKCLILDYGVGNIASVRTFLRDNDYSVTFGKDLQDIRETDLLVLPGVGSFETAAERLNLDGIADEIRSRHLAQRPILGICLGFQLLTTESAESNSSKGLGIFQTTTGRLKELSRIGWDKTESQGFESYCLDDFFFFNHSYGVYDFESADLIGRSGQSNYVAMVIVNKTVGVQFHPERSQESGKRFIRSLENQFWNLND